MPLHKNDDPYTDVHAQVEGPEIIKQNHDIIINFHINPTAFNMIMVSSCKIT